MAKTKTLPWDPAEHLETEEDMAMYLNIALEDGDQRLIIATLEDIARARRITGGAQGEGKVIGRGSGIGRLGCSQWFPGCDELFGLWGRKGRRRSRSREDS